MNDSRQQLGILNKGPGAAGQQDQPRRLAPAARPRYRGRVTVNPVADLGRSSIGGVQAPITTLQALFLRPQCCVMAAVRGTSVLVAGVPGYSNPVGQPAHSCHHYSLGRERWQLHIGAPPMKHDPARNPSALRERAQAHRAMALAALRADSSLSVRLKRYNAAIAKARALEAEADQQQTTSTRDPRAALEWLKAGKALRIDSINLRDHLRHMRALAALEARGGAK